MLEDAENIDELVAEIKKHTLSFSKFYSKVAITELSQFMFKDRETQTMMLDSIYETNSKLEQLLRGIMEYGINAETFNRQEDFGAETEDHNHHHHQHEQQD